MSVKISAKILGQDKLLKALQRASGKIMIDAQRGAMKRAVEPILKAAKAGAPKVSGALRVSISKKIVYSSRTQSVTGMVGARSGYSKNTKKNGVRKPSRYLHLIEKGTKNTAANPFMRRAYLANVSTVTNLYRSELKSAFERSLRRREQIILKKAGR